MHKMCIRKGEPVFGLLTNSIACQLFALKWDPHEAVKENINEDTSSNGKHLGISNDNAIHLEVYHSEELIFRKQVPHIQLAECKPALEQHDRFERGEHYDKIVDLLFYLFSTSPTTN